MLAEGESEEGLMQTSRIIDRLTGRGGVERDRAIICEVEYDISISQPTSETQIETPGEEQNTSETKTPPGTMKTTGTPGARGRLRVLEGKRNLMEGDLTLCLTDGRRWKFTVTNGNPVSALYLVVQNGGDSLAPVQT